MVLNQRPKDVGLKQNGRWYTCRFVLQTKLFFNPYEWFVYRWQNLPLTFHLDISNDSRSAIC